MATVTPDVFDSQAVAILCALEADGFTVQLEPDNGIVIVPRSRLTPDRVAAFRQQLEATRTPMVPAFMFRPGVAYVHGVCFSCGDALPELRFGRCWRCSVAWRLACRLPIDGALADALDTARVCA